MIVHFMRETLKTRGIGGPSGIDLQKRAKCDIGNPLRSRNTSAIFERPTEKERHHLETTRDILEAMVNIEKWRFAIDSRRSLVYSKSREQEDQTKRQGGSERHIDPASFSPGRKMRKDIASGQICVRELSQRTESKYIPATSNLPQAKARHKAIAVGEMSEAQAERQVSDQTSHPS